MKSTQIHLKSIRIDEIHRKPVLANEREARFCFFGKCKEEPMGTNRSEGEAIGDNKSSEEAIGDNKKEQEQIESNRQ